MDVRNDWWFRCFLFLIGLLIISLGINVNIMASFGVGGWDAYNIALSNHIGFSIGFWLNVNAVIYIIITALLRKRRLRVETILTSLLLGVFIDTWGIVFQGYHIQGFWFQLLWFLIAIVTISIGAGIYLVSKLPPNPIDDLMLAITDRFNCSISTSKIIVEGSGVVLGLTLNGPVGLGTVLMLIIFGPIIQFFYKRSEMLYKKRIERLSKYNEDNKTKSSKIPFDAN